MVRPGTSRSFLLVALWCAGFGGQVFAQTGAETSFLHPIFQDHLVLQRNRPSTLSGTTDEGAAVSVSIGDHTTTVIAGDGGRWVATLPPLPPGGPYTLSVTSTGGDSRTVDDVRVGDVFLCSGQSNMVLPVHRTLNSRAEIDNSANAELRMLTVPFQSSLSPLVEFADPVVWQVAAPHTVGDWSATCYYFARELQKDVDAPIGMVVAAVGGANMKTWMSSTALRTLGTWNEELDLLDLYRQDPTAGVQRWGEVWEQWWRSRTATHEGAEPWRGTGPDDTDWAVAPTALGPWEEWGVAELADFDGMVWYRTTVDLTAEQAAQTAVLSLGRADEIDQTWVNGQLVGTTSGASSERVYPLARGLLRPGENRIVVNVLDTWDRGGLYGASEDRALHLANDDIITLDHVWWYAPEPAEIGWPPRTPWDPIGGMTTSYNAMVAPLVPFAFRGVVWYQGESNTGDAEQYAGLLEALMADWRSRFGDDLLFLIVQLANYGRPSPSPVESGWAEVREAQRRVAMSDPRAALAVTIDIGDRYDIHPPNKQEVGRRLARAARRILLGENLTASGPVALRAARTDDQVAITFGDVDGHLLAYGAEAPVGFELCGSAPGTCHWANARIDGDRVLLDIGSWPRPDRVRYCWADSPICTLYDGAGLPAGPFELDID